MVVDSSLSCSVEATDLKLCDQSSRTEGLTVIVEDDRSDVFFGRSEMNHTSNETDFSSIGMVDIFHVADRRQRHQKYVCHIIQYVLFGSIFH